MEEVIQEIEEFTSNVNKEIDTLKTNRFSTNEQILEQQLSLSLDSLEQIIYLQAALSIYRNDVFRSIDVKLDEIFLAYENYKNLYEERLDWNTIYHSNNLELKATITKSSRAGRPKIEISEMQVLSLKSLNFSWVKIATLLGISSKTLQRRRKDFSSNIECYSKINDLDLDVIVRETIDGNPNVGERMITGYLAARGIQIQRERIRKSIKRVDPNRSKLNKKKIYRRSYNVISPNALWHLDGNHKLIRWRFVIHGCLDGFSRSVVFLKCAVNNRSDTVLDSFVKALDRFRTPLRIRTDHGTENVLVARYMLDRHGIESKPVITGKSVHNQRIERLWVDVSVNVNEFLRNLFRQMESDLLLDPDNDLQLYALHYVFLPRINRMLFEFSEAWNNHPVSTERNRTPLQIWTEGFYRLSTSDPNKCDLLDFTENIDLLGIDFNGPTPELQTQNHVVIPEVDLALNDAEIEYLVSNFDPLENDGDHGIQVYNRVVVYLSSLPV